MVASFTLTAIAVASLWVSCAAGKKNYSIRPEVVLPANYVKEIPPPTPPGQPVIIYVDIFVVDINSINVENMDFRVDMFSRQQWTEPRLQMREDMFEDGEDSVTLPPEFFDNLWQPDPYIINSKVSGGPTASVCSADEIATLNQKFSSVTLYRNKTVRYSARMHAIVACQMEFQLYPMDIQLCPVYMESFSYNERKLSLRWGEDAVSVNPVLKLLQYRVGPLELSEAVYKRPEKDGNFSRLTAFFRFERQIGHHLIQTFAPSTLVVMLSWCGFWLGLDAIPGRVTLLVTCMLTLVTMFTGLKQDIPPVAYVKALDVWMAGCMLFVFGALGEFVVVKVLNIRTRSHNTPLLPLRIAAMDDGALHYSAWTQHIRYVGRQGCRIPIGHFGGNRTCAGISNRGQKTRAFKGFALVCVFSNGVDQASPNRALSAGAHRCCHQRHRCRSRLPSSPSPHLPPLPSPTTPEPHSTKSEPHSSVSVLQPALAGASIAVPLETPGID